MNKKKLQNTLTYIEVVTILLQTLFLALIFILFKSQVERTCLIMFTNIICVTIFSLTIVLKFKVLLKSLRVH